MHYKMINLDSITNEMNKKHNEKWPCISDHPYRILITGGFGSWKTNALLNLVNKQNNIDKIYSYAKDLNEQKYEYLIRKRKNTEINYWNYSNAFIQCSKTTDDVYENIDHYNRSRKRKFLIVFDDMIVDVKSNENFTQ